MAIYRNLKVDIPTSHVLFEKHKNSDCPIIKYVIEAPYNREKGFPQPKRVTIGHQCADDPAKMHPTTQYQKIFPKQWENLMFESNTPPVKRIGVFTLLQAINQKTGLLNLLTQIYGVQSAYALLEQALYPLLYPNKDTFQELQALLTSWPPLGNEVLFAAGFEHQDSDAKTKTDSKQKSESALPALFFQNLTKDQESLFCKTWAASCLGTGLKKVWLCVDGSNQDWSHSGVKLMENDHLNNPDLKPEPISFACALNEEGKPVFYDVFEGGLTNSKALLRTVHHLEDLGFFLEGILVTRGVCTPALLELFSSLALPCLILVNDPPASCKEQWIESGKAMKMNLDYLIPFTTLFGMQMEMPVFSSLDKPQKVALLYDFQQAHLQTTTLLDQVFHAQAAIQEQLDQNRPVQIDPELENFLIIDPEASAPARINRPALQQAIDRQGLEGWIYSCDLTLSEIQNIQTRQSRMESYLKTMKIQLGYGQYPVILNSTVNALFLIGFLRSIIGYELEQAVSLCHTDLKAILEEIHDLQIHKHHDNYVYAHNQSDELQTFFESLGIRDMQSLVYLSVAFENHRLVGLHSSNPDQKINPATLTDIASPAPRRRGVKPGTIRGPYNKNGAARKKPGVPVGTKRGLYNKDGSLRKKPGRKSRQHENKPK